MVRIPGPGPTSLSSAQRPARSSFTTQRGGTRPRGILARRMSRMWDWLRITRHDPMGRAQTNTDNAKIYRAALQQFEELVRAAESSGAASRPLPLFYALTQAGRAIIAVKGGSEHIGHGLRLGPSQENLLETLVKPQSTTKRPGHFQAVADAVRSPGLDGPTPIGALIASLPENSDPLFGYGEVWPKALSIWPREWHAGLSVPDLVPIVIGIEGQTLTYDDLVRLLEPYRTVKDKITISSQVLTLPSLPTHSTPEGLGVDVLLRGTNEELDSVAPQYRIAGRRWIRPAIAGGDSPTPLMTWWLVLYALSMFARYYPREWVAALDVDSSPFGVVLDRTMVRGILALPQLVLSEVIGVPILLPWESSTGMDPFG